MQYLTKVINYLRRFFKYSNNANREGIIERVFSTLNNYLLCLRCSVITKKQSFVSLARTGNPCKCRLWITKIAYIANV